jgi:hypothetical protein
MGCGSFVRDAGGHERHTRNRRGKLPVMSRARVEGPAFASGLGNRNPDHGRGRHLAADVPRLRRVRTGGDPMTLPLSESDPARLAIDQLNALAVDLSGRGFLTGMVHEAGMRKLLVANQAVPSCREHITVAADDDGAWWFRWSWGDRITLVDQIGAAAFKVAYVLTPQAG